MPSFPGQSSIFGRLNFRPLILANVLVVVSRVPVATGAPSPSPQLEFREEAISISPTYTSISGTIYYFASDDLLGVEIELGPEVSNAARVTFASLPSGAFPLPARQVVGVGTLFGIVLADGPPAASFPVANIICRVPTSADRIQFVAKGIPRTGPAFDLSVTYTPIAAQEDRISAKQQLRVFPNPVQDSATIHYVLAGPSRVQVNVYDITGRLVKGLLSTSKERGTYEITWNGSGEDGNRSAEGVYFIQLVTGLGTTTERLVLTR